MKIKIIALILAFVQVIAMLMIYSCEITPRVGPGPFARRGVIDLSQWDCRRDGPVRLDGEWEFFDRQKLSPVDFVRFDPPKAREYIRVPEGFSPSLKMYSPGYQNGFATYRLKVITGADKTSRLGLCIELIHPLYRLYINGLLVHGDSSVVVDQGYMTAGYSNAVVSLPEGKGVYDIVLQAANSHFPIGGINFSINLGCLGSLQASQQRNTFLPMVLVIILLLVGLGQFALFSLQRSNFEYLYYGLSCIGVLLYTAEMHSAYWSSLFPFFPWDGADRFLVGALYVGNTFFMGYIRRLFPTEMTKGLFFAYAAASLALGLAVVVVPKENFGQLLPVYHGQAIAAAFVYYYIAILATARRRDGALIILAGIAIGTLAVALFILRTHDLLPSDFDSLLLSLVINSLVQAIVTARHFIHVRRLTNHLAAEYDKLKTRLDERMRTDTRMMTESIEGKIKAAVDYLRENFTEDISRENLAGSIGMHPDNFSHYLKIFTGKKYNDYVNELRVSEAARLLRETEHPIIEIAMNAGFRSLRTFNHSFIKIIGCKPSDYRKAR